MNEPTEREVQAHQAFGTALTELLHVILDKARQHSAEAAWTEASNTVARGEGKMVFMVDVPAGNTRLVLLDKEHQVKYVIYQSTGLGAINVDALH